MLNTSPLRVKILGVYGIFDCLPRGGRNVVTFSLNFYTKENFIIERTGVCVWLIGKTSSQNILKAILLELESSWIIGNWNVLLFALRKWYSFFQEYLRIHNKYSTRPKKGEIFRIILRIFFNLLLGPCHGFFIYDFLFTHCEERNPMGGELFCKKEEEEYLEHASSRFEVQKNCTPKLLNFRP